HAIIQHAREEITRCNVELRRLHTSIVDENKLFSRILRDLEGSLMHGPVSEYIDRRQSINQLLLTRIHQTYSLEGYTGERTPGIHINSSIFQPDSGNGLDEDLANGESSDEGDEGDDDEFTEGLGAVVDFMSNISLHNAHENQTSALHKAEGHLPHLREKEYEATGWCWTSGEENEMLNLKIEIQKPT
ncbi:hypothetical protein F5880DRAFT_1512320, partial [Lentinula raphanica]